MGDDGLQGATNARTNLTIIRWLGESSGHGPGGGSGVRADGGTMGSVHGSATTGGGGATLLMGLLAAVGRFGR